MKQFSYDRLWKHSMMTAIFARKIIEGQTGDKTVQEEAFAAALLHDLGKVMMAFNLGDRYGNALALARDKQIPLCEAEREVMEASHADIGAYLLGLWGLPINIVEAVALHHAPRANALESFSPLTAVHVANALQHELDPENEGLVRSSLDEDYLEALDLTEQLPGWRKAVAERHLEAA